jgi:hypothetical protein
LIVTGGAQDGLTVACEGGPKLLGSGLVAQVRISAGNVAASHALLEWDGAQLSLSDAGSATGTFVNGEKIGSDRHPVSEGDRVYLGPPGSPDSVSLLVCPPENAGDGDLLLDPLPGFSAAAEPLLLDPEPMVLPLELSPPAPLAPPPPAAPASSADTAEAPPLPLVPPPGPPKAKLATSGSESGVRKASRGDYTSDMPSIGGERVREPIQLPPSASGAKKPAPSGRKKGGGAMAAIPRPALIGGGTLALGVVLFAAYSFLHAAPPVLLTVTPSKAEPGGTLTLTGDKFSSDAAKNTVRFGEHAGTVVSASEKQLSVTIPADAIGNVPVTVQTSGGRSNGLFCDVFRGPRVTTVAPLVAMPGEEVVISGLNLNAKPPVVSVNGHEAEVLDAQPTSIRVRMPAVAMVEGKEVPISVQVGDETARPVNVTLGHLPLLTQIDPASGPAGTRVTLHGVGFASEPSGNVVRFGTKRAAVLSATPTELVVSSTGADLSGSQLTLDVRAEVGGTTSSPKSFILLRPSGVFIPRFFAESIPDAAGHDHVAVATDIGPLLVLSGRGEAASIALRAATVADTLNGVVDAALAGRPATVELREKPAPCVAIAGAPNCLVTPGPEDVAAYDEPWTSAKGAKANARALAVQWTSLIGDYLLLFVQKQRPYHLLETSPRGKVLLELYAEAVRMSGAGNGVPVDMVTPVPGRLQAPLREMALVLPGETQARGAAAIEGLWSGQIEDGHSGREIKVRFRMENGKPQGSLTTGQGKLTMDLPLSGVSYERGAVQFVASLAGQPTTFKGVLDQGVIKGTIHPADAKQSGGQFTLSFIE